MFLSFQSEKFYNLYVTRQAVSRWECGARYPDLLTAKKLSDVLEVSLDELLSGEEMKKCVEKSSLSAYEYSGASFFAAGTCRRKFTDDGIRDFLYIEICADYSTVICWFDILSLWEINA